MRRHWQWIENELRARLECCIREYRDTSLAFEHSSDSHRERAASEKRRAVKDYEHALHRFNDFVIQGIVPPDLAKSAKERRSGFNVGEAEPA